MRGRVVTINTQFGTFLDMVYFFMSKIRITIKETNNTFFPIDDNDGKNTFRKIYKPLGGV
jgi:hypothetical protein